ncbi:MAG TPA: hypothetical protein VFB96_03945 [Pirellulaceae bacterium]|nr:hypothetical protein [Pirellulaceae bacterium]
MTAQQSEEIPNELPESSGLWRLLRSSGCFRFLGLLSQLTAVLAIALAAAWGNHRASQEVPTDSAESEQHPIICRDGRLTRAGIASQTHDEQAESLAQAAELNRQWTLIVNQQDRLVNLRIADEIDEVTFARKQTELRDRLAAINLQRDVLTRSHDETADLAVKVFELSQTLRQQWLTADYAAKRRILEIVLLNCRLDDVNLVPQIRKPFDVLAEGLVSENSRGDRI